MDVRLEKIENEDIAEINRIQKLAFRESYEKYKFCPAYEVTDEEVIAFLEKADAYKIVANGTIAGSIFICKIKDREYDLNTITILPELQNKGIGSQAILEVEGYYPEAVCWTLQTPDTDDRNCHLYEKHGYLKMDKEVINETLTLIRYQKLKETL